MTAVGFADRKEDIIPTNVCMLYLKKDRKTSYTSARSVRKVVNDCLSVVVDRSSGSCCFAGQGSQKALFG